MYLMSYFSQMSGITMKILYDRTAQSKKFCPNLGVLSALGEMSDSRKKAQKRAYETNGRYVRNVPYTL